MSELTTTEITASEARRLTDDLKEAVEMTWDLAIEAWNRQAWKALGYGSWDAYCSAEFQTSRLRLPREERSSVVASLRDAGLSVRAIAAVTGESKSTIGRELTTVPNGTLPAEDAWSWVLSGRNPAAKLGVRLSDDEWGAILSNARDEADDVGLISALGLASDEVFEAAITLCRASGDLSRDKLLSRARRRNDDYLGEARGDQLFPQSIPFIGDVRQLSQHLKGLRTAKSTG